jgi:hypothetical protein
MNIRPDRISQMALGVPLLRSANYLAFLQMKARVGIEIDVVDSDASGRSTSPRSSAPSARARG